MSQNFYNFKKLFMRSYALSIYSTREERAMDFKLHFKYQILIGCSNLYTYNSYNLNLEEVVLFIIFRFE